MNFSLFYFLFDATIDKVFLTINIYNIIYSSSYKNIILFIIVSSVSSKIQSFSISKNIYF